MSLLGHESLVVLDANINLLNLNHNINTQLYLETIFSNGFNQKVGKATRIMGNSYSLIDHILTKNNNVENVLSGTILTDISDHFMNFVEIPTPIKTEKNEYVQTRNFSVNNMNRFRNNLRNCNWRNVTSNNDVNESYDIFWSDFNTMFDMYFPLKRVKLNRNIHKINQFMTTGLLTSRKTKNLLHKKALLDPLQFSQQYKNYRNTFNSLIRLSKQTTVEANFKKHVKNPKKHGTF